MKRVTSCPISVLEKMSSIPKHMLQLADATNACEFVLHDLACKDCFNLSKAAYFVDNPAFDCLKGLVGIAQQEMYDPSKIIWEDPADFSRHMEQSRFNQKVRQCFQSSCRRCERPDEHIIAEIAEQLDMKEYAYCTWDLKHENHGYLIYQPCENTPDVEKLLNGFCLLGFCPIY
jgi:hypothetical protein